ncbi:MAG: hypothetical protein GWN58_03165 [Anaerolineae bacterium]|nr:hypothetical protein [Anaerolineae bacterium]
MSWEWPVVIYLWLAGLAGGAYFVAFLADLFSGGKYHDAKRVAAALGVPSVILGVLMLLDRPGTSLPRLAPVRALPVRLPDVTG